MNHTSDVDPLSEGTSQSALKPRFEVDQVKEVAKTVEDNDIERVNVAALQVMDYYKDRADSLLQVATFAGAITFTIILTPNSAGGSQGAILGFKLLTYANSLFCGAIIGCIFVITGVGICKTGQQIYYIYNVESTTLQPDKKIHNWLPRLPLKMGHLIHLVAGLSALSIYVAFYLLLYATRLFLGFDGPFILATLIYGVLGLLTMEAWIRGVTLGRRVERRFEKEMDEFCQSRRCDPKSKV